MRKIEYRRHDRFEKQLKKLGRKYHGLEGDLIEAQKSSIELFHILKMNNNSLVLVPGFDRESIQIYKIRKFSCKALKGKGNRSGIRVIYAFYPEKLEVEFLEIYYKEKDDSDMDREFVQKYLETKK